MHLCYALAVMALLRWCILGLALTPAACGPPAYRGGFDSPNPAAKMYAIEHAARTNDHTAIPRIVEQLDSDDPAVRMLAIATLKRLTGETLGYCEYDPPHRRREAIARWVEKVNGGSPWRAVSSQ